MNIIEIGKQVLEIEARELEAAVRVIDRSFERAVETFLQTKGRVVVTGMGKSGLIGKKIAATLTSTGTPSVFLHPAEAIHGDLGIIMEDDSVLALSSSGETSELIILLGFIKRMDVKIVAITGDATSTLAKESDVAVNFSIKEEACPTGLVPSASTTLTLAIGDAIAIALMNEKGFSRDDFRYFHPGGSIGKKLLKVKHIMHTRDDLPLAGPNTSMSEVIKMIDKKKFGCAIIVDGQSILAGIITDGDLRRLILKGVDLSASCASECMTEDPLSITEDQLCSEGLNIMEKNKVTSLVVKKQDTLIGLLHLHDLWRTELI
jgi:arabinose-5-phosphate isomerase